MICVVKAQINPMQKNSAVLCWKHSGCLLTDHGTLWDMPRLDACFAVFEDSHFPSSHFHSINGFCAAPFIDKHFPQPGLQETFHTALTGGAVFFPFQIQRCDPCGHSIGGVWLWLLC
mmetsp:Transcript_27375/g.43612  ORF Transcript_27375/g.43612 Transcript_27375/m.43612 type:complete len:117 (-) Transcript_27375:311-661(-)